MLEDLGLRRRLADSDPGCISMLTVHMLQVEVVQWA